MIPLSSWFILIKGHFMDYYFKLQFLRIQRWMQEQGIPIFLGVLGILLVFIAVSYVLFLKTDYASWIYVAFGLTIIFNYQQASEKRYLQHFFQKSQLIKIRGIENFIIQLPFFLYLILKEFAFYEAAILLISALLLSFINTDVSRKLKLPTPFKKRPFEFIVGFRITFVLSILAYFLMIKAIQVDNFQLGIFSLAILFFQAMSFYSKPENPYFVWIFKDKPKAFLWHKIRGSLINSTLLSFPLLLILIIFFPMQSGWILGMQCLGYLFVTSMILAKYASYPNPMGVPQALLYGLSLWFPPFLILVMVIFYRRSLQQLNELLI